MSPNRLHLDLQLQLLPYLILLFSTTVHGLPTFHKAPAFRNGANCPTPHSPSSTVHIAMTLDTTYLRGSIVAVYSVLRHSTCPENLSFHFLLGGPHSHPHLRRTISATFPSLSLSLSLHHFNPSLVRRMISSSLRRALNQPLNYARIYLVDILPSSLSRVIYLDSDVILVDDIASLWNTPLNNHILGAPEHCHANFSSYFTANFWNNPELSRTFRSRNPCYFNTGVMIIDLASWRLGGYTAKLEHWMRVQKRHRIYELGSLPPFLLVFGGAVEPTWVRWGQCEGFVSEFTFRSCQFVALER